MPTEELVNLDACGSTSKNISEVEPIRSNESINLQPNSEILKQF